MYRIFPSQINKKKKIESHNIPVLITSDMKVYQVQARQKLKFFYITGLTHRVENL